MSLIAPVDDGQIITSTTNSTNNTTTAKSATGNTMDKEAFLQLLVAQMKYQDPLQPTSNTEYIAQYAQFSQVESLQNMSSSMDLQRASALVGKNICVQTTTASGESTEVEGIVDYVSFESGKAYVYINENRYSLDEVQYIVDEDYYEAYNLATDLVTSINKLPGVASLGLSDGETVDELYKVYNNMTEYQKSFVAQEKVEVLRQYVGKIAELRALKEENDAGKDTDVESDADAVEA